MRRFGFIALALFGALAGAPAVAAGQPAKDDEIVAYADGRRISVEDIPRYYCDDFSYPVIQCSSLPLVTDSRALTLSLVSGADYVTIYDQAGYLGTYMHLSQDYAALLTIGWNDRVSSFKGRNGETGKFWTDWFNSGTSWSFCCNTGVSTLGSFNNTFSSVERT